MLGQEYFPFSKALQDSILLLLFTDRAFLQICRHRVDPKYFTSPIQQKLCKLTFDFFDKYKEPTDDLLADAIFEFLPEKEHELMVDYLETVFELNPVKDYVIEQLDGFIQERSWETALVDCVELLKKKDFLTIENTVLSAVKNKMHYSQIKDVLTEDLADFYKEENEMNELCTPTGVKALDGIIGGIRRKELSVIVAPLNVGKSWFLTYIGSKALIYGKNVLHVTLEMSKRKTKGRYLMRFAGVASKDWGNVEIWDGERKVNYKPDTIYNIKKVGKALKAMRRYKGKLFLDEYPSDTLTISKLEGVLNTLEMENGVFPDLLIVDGADDMKGEKKYEADWIESRQTYKGLRRLAMERNMAVLTVSHCDETLASSKLIMPGNISRSKDKMRIADLAISINQTIEEQQEQQARLFIMRCRSDEKWRTIKIHQNLKLGHFCVHSELMENNA